MRRSVFVTFVFGAAMVGVLPGGAAAQGPFGEGTLQVRAVNGPEYLPVSGVAVGVTACSGGPVVASLTTGGGGTASQVLPSGCYQAEITSGVSGCELDGDSRVQVAIVPGVSPTADFHFRCA